MQFKIKTVIECDGFWKFKLMKKTCHYDVFTISNFALVTTLIKHRFLISQKKKYKKYNLIDLCLSIL